MAKKKSRAQRKADAARRREQQLAERARRTQQEAQAQHDTQAPESGVQVELEAEMEIAGRQASQVSEVEAEPESLAPSRADVGTGEEATGLTRRERKRLEREREARARQSAERRQPKAPQVERQRNIVVRFLSQVARELSRVQWPDRPHLVQASVVTLIFVAIAAAYLGLLDQVFSRLVDLLIT